MGLNRWWNYHSLFAVNSRTLNDVNEHLEGFVPQATTFILHLVISFPIHDQIFTSVALRINNTLNWLNYLKLPSTTATPASEQWFWNCGSCTLRNTMDKWNGCGVTQVNYYHQLWWDFFYIYYCCERSANRDFNIDKNYWLCSLFYSFKGYTTWCDEIVVDWNT